MVNDKIDEKIIEFLRDDEEMADGCQEPLNDNTSKKCPEHPSKENTQ